MRNVFITTIAAMAFAGAAQAADLTGEVTLGFTEQASGKYGGAMDVELGVDAGPGTVNLDFTVVDGGALTLDHWTVGTTVGVAAVAIGDDNGVMPGAEGEQTLTAPAMTESVQVTVGAAAVAVGFTNWTADISDISNVQGAYTLGTTLADVTVAADYNFTTENTVLGAGVSGIDVATLSLGGAVSYDVDAEVFGFEAVADVMGATVYANGTDANALQNIGGEYTYNFGGADLTGGAVYNVDTKDITPSVSLAFAF